MDIGADQVGEVILLAREMVEQFVGADDQFDGLIEGMNDDQRLELVALVWIGRGDFEPEEWADAVRMAREREDAASLSTSDWLLGIPNLADLLDEGLAAMGRSCA